MNEQRNKATHAQPINPIFARAFGSNDVVIMNSLFQAGMRPAKDLREQAEATSPPPDARRN